MPAGDNVTMRNFGGLQEVMRATDKGTAKVPHHIVDDVALTPLLSVPAVDSLVLSVVAASLIEYDIHAIADGYIFIFNAIAKPANGARTPIVVPKFVSAGTWLNVRPRCPYKCATGIVICFSSTLNIAGAWNFTASAQAIFSGQVGAATGEAS